MKVNFIFKTFKFLFVLVLVGMHTNANAQDVILETQADVDAFDPATTVINGSLTIGRDVFSSVTDIEHIDNLSNLVEVRGSLSILSNKPLENLDALSNLATIQNSLFIDFNKNLNNIDGLSNLSFVGMDVGMRYNDILENINGLIGLSSIGGKFELQSHEILSNIDGLSNVASIGGRISLSLNKSLLNVDGLSGLTTVEEELNLNTNEKLNNLLGFNGINTINGELIIRSNHSLKNIEGLNNLTTANSNIIIQSNDSLENLNALTNLTTVEGDFEIRFNDRLEEIGDFSSLTNVGGNLFINSNENLKEVDGFNELTSVNGILGISSNTILDKITGFNGLSIIGESFIILTSDNLIQVEGFETLSIIGGNFRMSSNDSLKNIVGFNSVTTIGGNFDIEHNDNLIHINGFNELDSIGGDFDLFGNDKLEDINGLSSITTITGNLKISHNAGLINIDGLSGTTSINGYIDLMANPSLINVNGLGQLATIGGYLLIESNESLENIDGFSSVNWIGEYVKISSNDGLKNLNGLGSIISIQEYLSIDSNKSLKNIDGLSSLFYVAEYLTIKSNDNLEYLNGLSDLTSIGSNLRIELNDNLKDLNGINGLTSVGGAFVIRDNINLEACCGILDILENQETAIGGNVFISGNPSNCSSEQEVIESGCGLEMTVSASPPCIGSENGLIQAYMESYDTIPFFYEWERQEDALTGNGVSESDDFTIEMLGIGTYNLTVTNSEPDTAIKLNIILSQQLGSIFEVVEVQTTNSSNGQNNGSITITTSGGTPPYSYSWSGVSSGNQEGVMDNFTTIPDLGFGAYEIFVDDNAGSNKLIEVSLLDESVEVIPCESPLDIVILNDVSGSVDATEYMESKQFFVDFLKEVNIGLDSDQSRAAVIEWSSSNRQQVQIPITGDLTILNSYIDVTRSSNDETAPHEAMIFGGSYLNANARPESEKVLILSTDGSSEQISSSLIALADEFKAKGFHIISIAFDGAFSNSTTREILRRVASLDALAPGAPAYSLLDAILAKNIVQNYLCPIDPGSSATAYFNRDGAIDIISADAVGNCPYPQFVDLTIDISAFRELSIPAGTPVTFYHNNPNQFGATPILTWQVPCAIPIETTERYNITLPIDGPSNIFAVFNDDGIQGSPINFPITDIEELAYTNNIDNIRVCLNGEPTLQALKYATLAIPACDTMVNYTINVCNISEVDAFGVTVRDKAPDGFVLIGSIFNDNGCATDIDAVYDIPANCCFTLSLTYDAGSAAYGYYGDQDVDLN